ncbi:MAG: hypothetical protein WAZ21_01860 [Candidatus Saccharimonadales bacterium]|jgi:hypothetical protein
MESGSQAPQPRFEQAPVPTGQTVERAPLPYTPETGIESGAERRESAAESAARQADGTPVLPTPVLPTTVPQAPVSDATVAQDDTPLVAADEDLIEKEWVDKAKKIILETRDDPYAREAAVTQLQADYLRKRYGKELGSAD